MNSAIALNHETKLPGQKGEPGGPETHDCASHARPNRWHNHRSGLAGLDFEADLRQKRINLRLRLRLEGSYFWPSLGEMPKLF